MTVYADVLFLINFAMIFFVLMVLRMFLREKKSPLLCALSAAVGSGGYILISFWQGLSFLRNILGFSLLVMACAFIAYLPKSFKGLLKLWGLVYVFAFVVGGICSGIFYYTKAGAYIGEGIEYVFKSISFKLLLGSVLCSYIIIKIGFSLYENRVIKKRQLYDVDLSLKEKRVSFRALGDTGNSLKDKITGKTVLAAEYEAVKGLLPEGELLERDIFGYMEKYGSEIKFSLIPYKSLGNSGGTLVCFRPDRVLIDGRGYEDIIIGISFMRLSEEGGFRGLINTEALVSEEVSKNACRAA
ncbi:MAG: sigma-E processing peptidase SpoIIGA [Clostridiales bacterium]|nr:sigma-E processing peptidase SpoIIGA [Clostridiales bacterium]